MRQRTFIYLDERISVDGLGDGRQLVKETPGAARIYALIENGEVTSYQAEDADGSRQALFTIIPDSADSHISPDGFCEVCTFDPAAGSVLCYTLLECPPPLEKLKSPHIVT